MDRVVKKAGHLFLIASLAGVFFLSSGIQSNLLLNWDVSWLLHTAKCLMAGGHYGKEFFEINPPMILYLYFPVLLIERGVGLSLAEALLLYVFLLSAVSLAMCHAMLERLFSDFQQLTVRGLTVILALSFLVLPAYEFGQRENLLVILVMPYVVLMALRAQGKTVPASLGFLVGVMAGCGFSIKPCYLVIPVLIELYYVQNMRQRFCLARIEIMAMAGIIILYLLSILIWHFDYLVLVVPVAMRVYSSVFDSDWAYIMLQPAIVFSLAAVILYFIQYKSVREIKLDTILFITLAGCLIACFYQGKIWYYHLLPAFSVALLLMALSLSSLCTRINSQKTGMVLFSLFAALAISVPVYVVFCAIAWGVEHKRQLSGLVVWLQKNASGHSVRFFESAPSWSSYAVIDSTHAIPSSWMPVVGWIPATLKRHDAQAEKDNQFFMAKMTEDFIENKPEFVFVAVGENKLYINDRRFDYIACFSQNEAFRRLWRHYKYTDTVESPGNYRFDIYARVS